MMRRWLLLALLIAALLLGGLSARLGALLAFAMPFVVYLGAALLAQPAPLQLQATRTLSADRVASGMPVVVRLAIANTGARRATILLEDRLPARLTLVEGAPRLRATLAPGETIEFAYTLAGKRGAYQLGDLQATTSDRLGLFNKISSLPAPGQLLIVPETIRLRRVEIRPRRTHVYAGQIPTQQGGAGITFFGVRAYQPGDPTRWINARTTARHAETLFVNEFEQERVADVTLILDARRRVDVQTPAGTLFEYAIQAAAALASVFLHHGNRVGLLIYGRSFDWTAPGYGKLQRERILRTLARAETDDLPVFEQLDQLPTRLFPKRSQLVLISALLPPDLPALHRLRAGGYPLMVISPDPISFEQRALGADPAVALAGRIAGLERALMLRRCQQAGIQIVDWQVERPFQQVAETALRRSPPWLPNAGGRP